jgi:hypothetical protein
MPKKASDAFIIKWPPFTDGDPAKWPPETPFCERMDNSPTAELWKKKIGQFIATVLQYRGQEYIHSLW